MAKLGRIVLLISAGFGAGLAACFIESAQPPTFRYQCSSDADCVGLEVCDDGLCQQPCGASLEACPQTAPCINGFCSSLCTLDDDSCPDPLACTALYESEDPEEQIPGVCTNPCDDTDNPCAEGQLCLPPGFCATLCMTDEECLGDESCTELAEGIAICTSGF